MEKRKKLIELLKVESVRPKKYNYGHKQVVVLPSPIQKKDMSDYQYAKDIDEKVVKMAVSLAEKMAISMVREMMSLDTDKLVDKITAQLSDKIAAAIPEQKTIIQQVVSQEMPSLKKEAEEFTFEGAEMAIDRSKGLKLHGKVGDKSKSTDSTDDALDALANMI